MMMNVNSDKPEAEGTLGLWQTRLLDGEEQKIWTEICAKCTQVHKVQNEFIDPL